MAQVLLDSLRKTLGEIRQPIREEVRGALLHLIASGEIRADEAVNLASVARRVGVSVTPVREALIQLEQDHIVTSAPGRGFVVRPLQREEAENLYVIISTLEQLAIDSLRLSHGDLAGQLMEANEEFRGAANIAEAFALDFRWHEILTHASGNRVLVDTLRPLRQRTWRYESRFMADVERRAASAEEHAGIQRELQAGDREEAKRILRANWASVALILDRD